VIDFAESPVKGLKVILQGIQAIEIERRSHLFGYGLDRKILTE
jgi:hypothetical protein